MHIFIKINFIKFNGLSYIVARMNNNVNRVFLFCIDAGIMRINNPIHLP